MANLIRLKQIESSSFLEAAGAVGQDFSQSVINIITNGVSVKPTYVANTSGSIKGGTTEQTMLGVTSSLATVNSVSASFSIVYNILANGTGSNILQIPANHQKSFVITNNNSSSFNFEGLGNNPTLTLFRGETYKFNVEAIETFGGIDMTVRRNAFGRQVDSFESELNFVGHQLRAVFIRAPWVEKCAPNVEVLARVESGTHKGAVVAVKQRNVIATSFHPEITSDLRIHKYFVEMVRSS